MEAAGRGRYRWRTRVRRRLPWMLVNRGVAAKGSGDCGDHDWYKESDEVDRCYHCEIGERRPSQFARLSKVMPIRPAGWARDGPSASGASQSPVHRP